MLVEKKPLRLSQVVAAVALLSPVSILLAAEGPRVPFLPLPFLLFETWEIPVYFAAIYFNTRTALFVEAVVYLVVQTTAFLGGANGILLGAVYNLAAVLFTLLGVSAASSLPVGKVTKAILTVSLAVCFRVLGMTLFNYVFLQLPAPIGYNSPATVVEAELVFLAIFNGVVALYSVAAGTVLASLISRRFSPSKLKSGPAK
jgi:riboflavin transporter FmnP